MAQKGVLTTSDYLPIEEFNRFMDCLHRDKLYSWELYCRISFCSSLRVSDVLTLRWKDILERDSLRITEIKTGKNRIITFNDSVRQKISELYILLGEPDTQRYIVLNENTGKPYTRQYINRMLKTFRSKYRIPIKSFSTHTFRKTFGRHAYEQNGCTEHALQLLCDTFNHTSTKMTRRYLGLRQEEIAEVFSCISF